MRIGKIEVTGGFFLILAWLNYLDSQSIIPLAMVACVCHELGHYWTICAMGGKIDGVRLTVIGAEMILSGQLNYWKEGVAALAGPAVNFLLARIFLCWERGALFSGINLILGLFNLLPVWRLDGGRVLHCALALCVGPDIAYQVGEIVHLLIAVLCFLVGIAIVRAGGNMTLLITSFWLLILLKDRVKE